MPYQFDNPVGRPPFVRIHISELKIIGLMKDTPLEVVVDVIWEDDKGDMVKSEIMRFQEEEALPVIQSSPSGESLYEAVKRGVYTLVTQRVDEAGSVV